MTVRTLVKASIWGLAVSVFVALSACGRVPQTENGATMGFADTMTEATESVPRSASPRPFLGFLRRSDPEPPEVELAATEPVAETAALGPSMTDAEIAAAGDTGDVFPEPSRRPRLFGFLNKRVPGEVTAPNIPKKVAEVPPAEREEPRARSGELFGQRDTQEPPEPELAALSTTPAEPKQGPVAGLPFGQIVKVCGVAPRKLGTEVARSEGAGTYRLYDSNPSSVAIRPQFITGFKDNCARQINAALALFGTSAVHEATRYNPLNTNPYSKTDDAYEKVKARLCGVRRGQACPENRAGKLARKAAFVSVYRGFGHSGDWLEMFLHDGEVVAYASRSN